MSVSRISIVSTLAFFCAGAMVGWLARNGGSTENRTHRASMQSSVPPGKALSHSDQLLAEARDLLADSRPFQRRLRLFRLVQKSNSRTLRKLLVLFPGDPLSRRIIATHWAEIDPVGLAEYLDADLRHTDRTTEQTLFQTWATTDPDAAWDYVMEHPGYRRNSDRAQFTMESILNHDLHVGMQLIAESPDSVSSVFWSRIKSDPAVASRLLTGLPDCAFKRNCLPKSMNAWAKQDAQAAIDWINTSKHGTALEREEQMGAVFDAVIASDIPLAKQILEQAENRELRTGCGEAIAAELALQDPESTIDWISETLAGAERRRALLSAVENIKDPVLAAELVTAFPPEIRSGAVKAVAENLYHQDPDAALQWSAGLEDPVEQTAAFGMIGNTVFHSQSAEALAELLKLNPDNAAMSIMAEELAENFPGADGLRWAEQLPSVHGEYLVRELFLNWANVSPELAKESLAAGDVPAHLRAMAVSGFAKTYFRDEPIAATEWAKALLSASGDSSQSDLTAIRRAVRSAGMSAVAQAAALAALTTRNGDIPVAP
ncbi:MAG: hypothetical protein ACI9R3_004735 [Verrucomicrobiales bacterium]|jgi:hypothetical protein